MAASDAINWGTTGTEPSQITHQLLPHITPNSSVRPGTIYVSLETYLAAPQDQGEVERTRGVVNNVGHSIADIVENANRTSGCMNQTFRSIADWAKLMEQQIEEIKKAQAGLGAPFSPKDKTISEIRAVQQLEQLSNDKAEFRNWYDRLVKNQD